MHSATSMLRVLCSNITGCDHLRDVFVAHMGLTDKDIVALSGGHTLVSSAIYLFSFPSFAYHMHHICC